MNNLSIEELKEMREMAEVGLQRRTILVLDELIAIRELKGDQVPVGVVIGRDTYIKRNVIAWTKLGEHLSTGTELFTAPQKPVDSDWIKCSDQLPIEHNNKIWIFNGEVHTGYALINGKFLDWNEEYTECENVTHWMPMRIPGAPKPIVGIVTDGE